MPFMLPAGMRRKAGLVVRLSQQKLSVPRQIKIIYPSDSVFRPSPRSAESEGEYTSTAPYAPYRFVFCSGFPNKMTALAFESYLKTGSGKAFAQKCLWRK